MEFFLQAVSNPQGQVTVREFYNFLNPHALGANASMVNPAAQSGMVEPGMFSGKGNEEIAAQYAAFKAALAAHPELIEQAIAAPETQVYIPVSTQPIKEDVVETFEENT